MKLTKYLFAIKAGDPTLADVTLQRSTSQGNDEWAAVGALGRAKRRHFTDVLQEHEVARPIDFATVTNAVYGGLWGRKAAGLKAEKGLKKTEADRADRRKPAP